MVEGLVNVVMGSEVFACHHEVRERRKKKKKKEKNFQH